MTKAMEMTKATKATKAMETTMTPRPLGMLLLLGLLGACQGHIDGPAGPGDGSTGPGDPPGEDPADDLPPPCDEELVWFETHLWQPLLSVQCVGCHSSEGPARNTRLVLQSEEVEGWRE